MKVLRNILGPKKNGYEWKKRNDNERHLRNEKNGQASIWITFCEHLVRMKPERLTEKLEYFGKNDKTQIR